MRSICLTLLALLATAGVAAAQIAAPSLNPTPTQSFMPQVGSLTSFASAPSNPAVLSWDGNSRIGATYGKTEMRDFILNPAINPTGKGNTSGFALEYVGDLFAAAAQSNQFSLDLDPFFGGTLKSKLQRIGVAMQFAKSISVGLGKDTVENTNSNTNSDLEQSLPLLGATVRLGEWFYIGAAAGTETVKDKVGQEQVKRSARQMGVGAMYRDKDRGFHAEVYRATRPAVLFPSTNPAAAEDAIDGATIEALLARILIGYATQTNKTSNNVGVAIAKNTVKTITVGFTMAPGLALVATRYNGSATDSSTGNTIFRTIGTNVGVAYQF